MRAPTTRQRVLIHLFDVGPQSTKEMMAALSLSQTQVLNAMSNSGIKKRNGVYTLPDEMRLLYERKNVEPYVAEIVPARVTNVFATNGLSAKYQVSALGNRPGSNDHLQIRSRHV